MHLITEIIKSEDSVRRQYIYFVFISYCIFHVLSKELRVSYLLESEEKMYNSEFLVIIAPPFKDKHTLAASFLL